MKKTLVFSLLFLLLAGCSAQNDSARNLEEINIPEQVNADAVMDKILFGQAVENVDSSRCAKVLDEALKKDCSAVVTALQTTQKAVQQIDDSLCGRIGLNRYKDNCMQSVADAEAKRDAEKLTEKDSALSDKLSKQDDLSKCDQVVDENFRMDCVTNILLRLASTKQDASYCKQIVDEQIKGSCLKQIE